MLDAARLPASVIDELKHVFGNHTGETDVVLDIHTSAGPRTLRLGEGYRVAPTPSLRAELEHILGPAAVQAAAERRRLARAAPRRGAARYGRAAGVVSETDGDAFAAGRA